MLQTPEELRKYIDGQALDASNIEYLKIYCAKYPDRVAAVNTILAVAGLGSLDPLLSKLLLRNVQHVLKCSGISITDAMESTKPEANRLLKSSARRSRKLRPTRSGLPDNHIKSQRYKDFQSLLMDGQQHSVLELMTRLDCCESSIQKWSRHLRAELAADKRLLRIGNPRDRVDLSRVFYQLVTRC